MNLWEVKCTVYLTQDKVSENVSRVVSTSIRAAVEMGERTALAADPMVLRVDAVSCIALCRIDAVEPQPGEKRASLIEFSEVGVA